MIKISIIVPVYNVQLYLKDCLSSILNQSFADFELILINDGSTDNSGKICDEYAAQDGRIKVIHKQNGGPGGARNAGLDIARGDYIMFCDSDDLYDADMAEYLLNALQKNSCDISMCGLRLISDTKILEERIVYKPERILKGVDLFREYFCNDMLISSPVNKLYKREVFNNLRYPEGMIYEDRYLSIEMFLNNSVYACGESKYNYYMRSGSIINSPFSEKRMDFLKVIDREEIIADRYPELRSEANKSYCEVIVMLMRLIILSKYKKNRNHYNHLLNLLKNKINSSNDSNIDRYYYKKYYKLKYLTIAYYQTRMLAGKMLRKIGLKR